MVELLGSHAPSGSPRRSAQCILITDLDNTLYDFVQYYEAGLAAVVNHFSLELGMDEDECIARLRGVFGRRSSIEYSFAVEEIDEVRRLPESSREEFVRAAAKAFWISAAESLTPYRTVNTALRHLHLQGVPVIAYTDAPVHEAIRRLHQIKCDRYISGLVAQRGFRRGSRRAVLLLRDLPGHANYPSGRRFTWRISPDEKKPNLGIYKRIADYAGSRSTQITVIGDSIVRDLEPAVELGYTGVWAKYGQRNHRSEGLMRKLVPNVLPEAWGTEKPPPLVQAVDTFQEVINFLPIQQLLPFDMSGL